MGKIATGLRAARCLACVYILLAPVARAQTNAENAATPQPLAWHQIGSFVVEQSLAGPAGGPVARVWYSQPAGGASFLFVKTFTGTMFQSEDFDSWKAFSGTVAPASADDPVPNLPEPGAHARIAPGQRARVYAFGAYVYQSEDGGVTWENKTILHGHSITGTPVHDLAIAPGGLDEITIATDSGVFRSTDGGDSWSSLNEGLPNLPAARLLGTPSGDQGTRIVLSSGDIVEWPPGQKGAWIPAVHSAADVALDNEIAVRRALTAVRGVPVSAARIAGDFIYSGTQTGDLAVSADRGANWRNFLLNATTGSPVTRFWIDPNDSLIALAIFGAAPQDPLQTTRPAHILRTMNGGVFWDDITLNLPDAAANGVTADRASNAVYIATDQGVFLSYTNLSNLGPPGTWVKVNGLNSQPGVKTNEKTNDVLLDEQGNQLWMALAGSGVYSTIAPHRTRDPRVVSAADLRAHSVAPGSLVSILGTSASQVTVGSAPAPILASTATATQVQIPFVATGSALAISANSTTGNFNFPLLTLAPAAPVILVAADGAPMLLQAGLEGEQAVALDASNPAHAGSRIQILAAGLGQVNPEWPTGLPAPLRNPPRVAGTVHAFVDRVQVQVNQATLAPGYVGFYLIDITIPKIVNLGPAELVLDVDGVQSNRVRFYIQP